jgi:hypothetical protein
MMDREEIIAAAKAATAKVSLEEYREAVEALREKGFTWRDIAEFLSERGVPTDHTRVYRLFGEQKSKRRTTSREVKISRITYIGEKLTKKRKTWSILEIEIPCKLGTSITLMGYAWGTDAARYALGSDDSISFRNPTLVMRSGNNGFPLAYITAEFQDRGEHWTSQEVYVAPKWEDLF